MKQLTQEEFDALGDGPHDARIVGVPPEDTSVLVARWGGTEDEGGDGYFWDIGYRSIDNWWFECGLPKIQDSPIWHKLPADYVDPTTE